MKSIQWTAFVVILLCGSGGFAQTDSLYYVNGLPVTGDTLDRKDSVDYAPANTRLVVAPRQLPSALVRSLDNDTIFRGWRNAVLERDRNTGLYWIFIPHNEVTRLYVVGENGDIVRMEETNKQE